MGYCRAFGRQIQDGCDHRMVAGAATCSCPECGAFCTGLYEGCPDVWAGRELAPSAAVSVEPRAVGEPVARVASPDAALGSARPDDRAFDWGDVHSQRDADLDEDAVLGSLDALAHAIIASADDRAQAAPADGVLVAELVADEGLPPPDAPVAAAEVAPTGGVDVAPDAEVDAAPTGELDVALDADAGAALAAVPVALAADDDASVVALGTGGDGAAPDGEFWAPEEEARVERARRARRRTVLVAAGVVAALVLGVGALLAATGGGGGSPPEAATLRFPAFRAGALDGARVWRLQGPRGTRFVGRLVFTNPTAKAVALKYDEVLPKSLARSADDVRFAPKPIVVVPDPIVRYVLDVPAKGRVVLRYRADVAPGGLTWRRLDRWRRDALEARAAYEEQRREAKREKTVVTLPELPPSTEAPPIVTPRRVTTTTTAPARAVPAAPPATTTAPPATTTAPPETTTAPADTTTTSTATTVPQSTTAPTTATTAT